MVALRELDPGYRLVFPDGKVPRPFRSAVASLDKGHISEGQRALAVLIEESDAMLAAASSPEARRGKAVQKATALDLQAKSRLSQLDITSAVQAYRDSFRAREEADPESVWKAKCEAGRSLRELAQLTGHGEAAAKAVEFYREAAASAPPGAFSYDELGLALLELGRREFDSRLLFAAKEAFERAVSEADRSGNAFAPRARALINLAATLSLIGEQSNDRGRFAEALQILDDILNVADPQSEMWARAQENRANALMGLDETEKAIKAFESALKVWSNHREQARCYSNIGYAYAQNGQYDEAQESFGKSLELQPDDERAPLFRAQVFHRMGSALSAEGEELIHQSSDETEKALRLLTSAVGYLERARSLRGVELAPFYWALSTVRLADTEFLLAGFVFDEPHRRSLKLDLFKQPLAALKLYLDAFDYLPDHDQRGVLGNIRKLTLHLQALHGNMIAFAGSDSHADARTISGRKEGDVRRSIKSELAALESLYRKLKARERQVLLGDLATARAAAEKGLLDAEAKPSLRLIRSESFATIFSADDEASPRRDPVDLEAPAESVGRLIASRFAHLAPEARTKAEAVVLTTLDASQANDIARLDSLFQAARLEIQEPLPPPRRLNVADFEEFKTFLAQHPWTGATGKSAAEFIRIDCALWLERDLALVDVRSAQPRLAAAYSAEISRDPSRRIPELYIKPHKLTGQFPSAKSSRRVSELTEEELAERRATQAAKVAAWRKAKRPSR